MFGRATIRLGIGPHSSVVLCLGGLVSSAPSHEIFWEERVRKSYFVSSGT